MQNQKKKTFLSMKKNQTKMIVHEYQKDSYIIPKTYHKKYFNKSPVTPRRNWRGIPPWKNASGCHFPRPPCLGNRQKANSKGRYPHPV